MIMQTGYSPEKYGKETFYNDFEVSLKKLSLESTTVDISMLQATTYSSYEDIIGL